MRLEFELSYSKVSVQLFNNYATKTPSYIICYKKIHIIYLFDSSKIIKVYKTVV